ncbi:hypothetical protein FB45DRAFT_351738 [Roridomyces roridus]|uniref:Uncharacterized protein n=1 Tax=Roridomyces roridus TaxID=1738132 RepID=A0AAD7FV41_9AGAR|nr:hypothetical protein FB45DRAFT_351738 [Roridomyces roridus]
MASPCTTRFGMPGGSWSLEEDMVACRSTARAFETQTPDAVASNPPAPRGTLHTEIIQTDSTTLEELFFLSSPSMSTGDTWVRMSPEYGIQVLPPQYAEAESESGAFMRNHHRLPYSPRRQRRSHRLDAIFPEFASDFASRGHGHGTDTRAAHTLEGVDLEWDFPGNGMDKERMPANQPREAAAESVSHRVALFEEDALRADGRVPDHQNDDDESAQSRPRGFGLSPIPVSFSPSHSLPLPLDSRAAASVWPLRSDFNSGRHESTTSIHAADDEAEQGDLTAQSSPATTAERTDAVQSATFSSSDGDSSQISSPSSPSTVRPPSPTLGLRGDAVQSTTAPLFSSSEGDPSLVDMDTSGGVTDVSASHNDDLLTPSILDSVADDQEEEATLPAPADATQSTMPPFSSSSLSDGVRGEAAQSTAPVSSSFSEGDSSIQTSSPNSSSTVRVSARHPALAQDADADTSRGATDVSASHTAGDPLLTPSSLNSLDVEDEEPEVDLAHLYSEIVTRQTNGDSVISGTHSTGAGEEVAGPALARTADQEYHQQEDDIESLPSPAIVSASDDREHDELEYLDEPPVLALSILGLEDLSLMFFEGWSVIPVERAVDVDVEEARLAGLGSLGDEEGGLPEEEYDDGLASAGVAVAGVESPAMVGSARLDGEDEVDCQGAGAVEMTGFVMGERGGRDREDVALPAAATDGSAAFEGEAEGGARREEEDEEAGHCGEGSVTWRDNGKIAQDRDGDQDQDQDTHYRPASSSPSLAQPPLDDAEDHWCGCQMETGPGADSREEEDNGADSPTHGNLSSVAGSQTDLPSADNAQDDDEAADGADSSILDPGALEASLSEGQEDAEDDLESNHQSDVDNGSGAQSSPGIVSPTDLSPGAVEEEEETSPGDLDDIDDLTPELLPELHFSSPSLTEELLSSPEFPLRLDWDLDGPEEEAPPPSPWYRRARALSGSQIERTSILWAPHEGRYAVNSLVRGGDTKGKGKACAETQTHTRDVSENVPRRVEREVQTATPAEDYRSLRDRYTRLRAELRTEKAKVAKLTKDRDEANLEAASSMSYGFFLPS